MLLRDLVLICKLLFDKFDLLRWTAIPHIDLRSWSFDHNGDSVVPGHLRSYCSFWLEVRWEGEGA